MTKRMITILLALVLCLGVIPAQAMAEGNEVTRVEWIQTLVDTCSMEVEEEACPDNYFSDISNKDEFYRDIIVAVEFGLIDTEPGLAFEPHAPATREFVAHTLNAALMFQLPEDTAYTYAESKTVTYPDDIQVAINQGWFALSGDNFLPEQAMTQSEMAAIAESITQILARSELEEDHVNTYAYVDDVKDVNDCDHVYLSGDNQVTIVGSNVALKAGDIFVVYLLDMPNAYKAQSVTTDGNTMVVDTQDVALEEVVKTMDIQGENEVDLAYFIPEEGIEPIYVLEDGTETRSQSYALNGSKKVKNLIINKDFPVGKVDVSVNLTLKNMTAKYRVDVGDKYAMFRLDGNLSMTTTAEVDLLDLVGVKTEYKLGVLDYGIGEAGVYAVIDAKGTCTLMLKGDFTAGMEFTRHSGLRSLSSFKRTDFSLVTEAKMKAGLQLKASMNVELVKAHAYLEIGAKVRIKNVRAEDRDCLDIVAYPYAEVDASAHADLVVWKDTQSKHYDILKEGDAPMIHYHYEHGIIRQECSFGDKEMGHWIGGWNKFNLGGRINESGSGGIANFVLYEYERNDNDDAVITKYHGNARSLYVPKTIDGYDVVGIGWDAFNSNQHLISVHIPDSVETISNSAFYNCKNLEYVKLPEGLTEIESNAFANCSSLRTLEIPDTVSFIGNSAFSSCTALVSVTLPADLKTIDWFAFQNCKSLTSVTIPKGMEEGGYRTFYNCTKLKEVILEEGMEKVPNSVLDSCNSIEQIVIPESVTTIGTSAFAGCVNLSDVTMGNAITRIEDRAFAGCTSLEEIDLSDSLTWIGDSAFADCTTLKGIEIPDPVTFIGRSHGNPEAACKPENH